MRPIAQLCNLITLSLLGPVAGAAEAALASIPDNRFCVEESAPPGSPLSGGYAELTVTDERLGRAQVYGSACFQNPLLGNQLQCFPVHGAMISDLATNSVQMSLAASALASAPPGSPFFGFAQQYLVLDATTLTGTHRTNGAVVQDGISTSSYIEGTARGIRCTIRLIADRRREILMDRFLFNLDRQ